MFYNRFENASKHAGMHAQAKRLAAQAGRQGGKQGAKRVPKEAGGSPRHQRQRVLDEVRAFQRLHPDDRHALLTDKARAAAAPHTPMKPLQLRISTSISRDTFHEYAELNQDVGHPSHHQQLESMSWLGQPYQHFQLCWPFSLEGPQPGC